MKATAPCPAGFSPSLGWQRWLLHF